MCASRRSICGPRTSVAAWALDDLAKGTPGKRLIHPDPKLRSYRSGSAEIIGMGRFIAIRRRLISASAQVWVAHRVSADKRAPYVRFSNRPSGSELVTRPD